MKNICHVQPKRHKITSQSTSCVFIFKSLNWKTKSWMWHLNMSVKELVLCKIVMTWPPVAELLVFMSLRSHLDFFKKLLMHVGTSAGFVVSWWVLRSNQNYAELKQISCNEIIYSRRMSSVSQCLKTHLHFPALTQMSCNEHNLIFSCCWQVDQTLWWFLINFVAVLMFFSWYM